MIIICKVTEPEIEKNRQLQYRCKWIAHFNLNFAFPTPKEKNSEKYCWEKEIEEKLVPK